MVASRGLSGLSVCVRARSVHRNGLASGCGIEVPVNESGGPEHSSSKCLSTCWVPGTAHRGHKRPPWRTGVRAPGTGTNCPHLQWSGISRGWRCPEVRGGRGTARHKGSEQRCGLEGGTACGGQRQAAGSPLGRPHTCYFGDAGMAPVGGLGRRPWAAKERE